MLPDCKHRSGGICMRKDMRQMWCVDRLDMGHCPVESGREVGA